MTTTPHLQYEERMLSLLGQNLFTAHLSPKVKARPEGAPTLVFLHDSLGCVATWRDMPHRVAEATGLNALVYDRFGYGRSDGFLKERTARYLHEEAQDILPLVLEAYGIQDVIFVGHSDGGSIALIAAATLGERVKACITSGAHVFNDAMTLKGVQAASEAFETTDIAERLAKYHGAKVEALYRAWVDAWRSEAFAAWSMEDLLPHIMCPLLAMQGRHDEYGLPQQIHTIIEKASGLSKGLFIDHCHHTPHRERPTLFLNETAHFIEQALSGYYKA